MKRIFYFVIVFINLVLSLCVQANLRLHMGLVSKKGINKGLVLVSELHSSNDIFGFRPVVLIMKDHLKCEVYAQLVPDFGIYGPSALVYTTSRFYDAKGTLIKDFSKDPLLIPLGKTKSFSLNRTEQGQSIEISIRPEFI